MEKEKKKLKIALPDNEISDDAYVTTINEERNYRKLKESKIAGKLNL